MVDPCKACAEITCMGICADQVQHKQEYQEMTDRIRQQIINRNRGENVDKNVLIQYCDMKEEIKDLRRRITETEKQIFRIAEEGTVKDTVSGGMGGIQQFVVEGMPVPELSRKRLLFNKRKAMLIEKENELLELMNQAEEYINSIEKSELRMMFRFYYIDGMTWLQVAHKMNQLHPKRRVAYTEDSCRMRNTRFFQEN